MAHLSVTVNLQSEIVDIIDSLIDPKQGYTRATWLRSVILAELERQGHEVSAFRQKFYVKPGPAKPTVDDNAVDQVMRKMGLSDGSIKSFAKVCTECDGTIPAGISKCPHCGL